MLEADVDNLPHLSFVEGVKVGPESYAAISKGIEWVRAMFILFCGRTLFCKKPNDHVFSINIVTGS